MTDSARNPIIRNAMENAHAERSRAFAAGLSALRGYFRRPASPRGERR